MQSLSGDVDSAVPPSLSFAMCLVHPFFRHRQTIVSIATGCAAGALGLTGLTGLLFFIVVFFLATLAFAAKLKFQIKVRPSSC